MSYTANPNFEKGNILKAEDLQKFEQAFIDSKNDWENSDTTSDGYVANRPFYKDAVGKVTWDGSEPDGTSYKLNGVTYKILPNVKYPNAKLMSGGTALINGDESTIGPYCTSKAGGSAAAIAKTIPFVLKGTALNLSNGIDLIMWVDPTLPLYRRSNSKYWVPLCAIISTNVTLTTTDGTEVEASTGVYVPIGTSTRFSELSYTDIIVHSDYQSFFDQLTQHIYIVEATDMTQLNKLFGQFKVGDIILGFIDVDNTTE